MLKKDIIPLVTEYRIGKLWFLIREVTDNQILLDNGCWCSCYDVPVLRDGLTGRKIPDSDFRYFAGESIDLLCLNA